jgi:hypothetical protein
MAGTLRQLLLAAAALTVGCGTDGVRSLDSGWRFVHGRATRADSVRRAAGDTATLSAIEAPERRPASRTAAKPAAPRADPPRSPERAARMRTDYVQSTLHRLRAAEARFFAQRRTYSPDLADLSFAPPPGTRVTVVWASRWGWAAVAGDSLAPTEFCAIHVGSVPDPRTPAWHDWPRLGSMTCGSDSSGAAFGRALLYGDETPAQTLARHAVTQMRHNLLLLTESQESYRSAQGAYARRPERLTLQYGWQPGVHIRMLAATTAGWAAEATFDQLPGKSCVVWGGQLPERPKTQALGAEPEREGVPACDE